MHIIQNTEISLYTVTRKDYRDYIDKNWNESVNEYRS